MNTKAEAFRFGVAPVRERGLKLNKEIYAQGSVDVAPVRERGLKYRLDARQPA